MIRNYCIMTEKFYESTDVRVMEILTEGILCSSPSLDVDNNLGDFEVEELN